MAKNPPQLFIYFVPNIKVFEATKAGPNNKMIPSGELWLCEIGTGNGIVHKFCRTSIPLWDRHFLALAPGFWWSGFLFRENTGVELTFSPEESKDIIFCIPEKYIIRVYDIANHGYIYQRLLPDPVVEPPKKPFVPCEISCCISPKKS